MFGIFFFFQAEDGIRDADVTGVQTCALPICAFQAIREVWFDAPPREDAAPGVRPLGASERSRRAEASDLRLSRFHACVCAQPAGAVYDSRPDHAHTPSTQCEGGGAVVPAPSAPPGRASGRGAQCQTPGPLPVLRATDELSLSPAVLSARSTALAHVVEPAHAREDARLDSLPTAAPASSVTPAAHLSRLGQHGESCVRNRVRQSRTLGSVRGGDGADTVTSTRARSRKRWIHAKGKPTAATCPLLLGNMTPTILPKKFEDVREAGAATSIVRCS